MTSTTIASLLAGATMCLGVGLARAEVIDLQWQAGDRFERSLVIAPGKLVELCGALGPGHTVRWSFQADRALNFNIHYHLGKNVRYPARQDQIARLQGELLVAAPQDHCWMWVNKAKTAAQLSVTLARQ